jgi:hypothetical protein
MDLKLKVRNACRYNTCIYLVAQTRVLLRSSVIMIASPNFLSSLRDQSWHHGTYTNATSAHSLTLQKEGDMDEKGARGSSNVLAQTMA